MPLFQVTPNELKPISETTFGAEGIMERKDIQRMLREQISVADWEATLKRFGVD